MERTVTAEAPPPLLFGRSDAAASNLRRLLADSIQGDGIGGAASSLPSRTTRSRSSRSLHSTVAAPLPSLRSSSMVRAAATATRTHGNSVARSTRGGARDGMTTRSRKRRASDLKPPPPGSAPAAAASPTSRKRARKPSTSLKKAPPKRAPKVVAEDRKLAPEVESESASCCICMCEPEAEDLALINGCEHRFCFDCIEKWAERENTCPLCKKRFIKIDRVNKRRKKGTKNTKKVKQRDQRSDLVPGAALEGLLANFASRHPFPPQSIARLIFSGVGGGFLEVPTPATLRFSGRAAAATAGEDTLLGSDADDEENPFSGLFRAIHGRSVVMGSQMSVMRPVSFTRNATVATRSYATNMNDRNAGNGAENPLEIEDSDSDDEEIEVVQVTRPSRR